MYAPNLRNFDHYQIMIKFAKIRCMEIFGNLIIIEFVQNAFIESLGAKLNKSYHIDIVFRVSRPPGGTKRGHPHVQGKSVAT